jgi:hypothetical protein
MKGKPKYKPTDWAGEAAAKAEGMIFGVKMYTLTHGTSGPPIVFDGKYMLRKMGFPKQRYVRIFYDTGWHVNVPVESDEELHRLAQVFMDLIASQS